MPISRLGPALSDAIRDVSEQIRKEKAETEHNRNLDLIEALIDKHGLAYVVDLMAEICSAKADHLEANWQDATAAKAWNRNAGRLLAISAKLDATA